MPIEQPEVNAVINYIAGELDRILDGEYVAILILGSAARGEFTFSPTGLPLSDLDILVVLPQKNLLFYYLFERYINVRYGNQLRQILRAISLPIQISFTSSSKLAWTQATPLMWELLNSSQVLRGSAVVKKWPEIVKNTQIPEWEGIRLIANRLCELYQYLSYPLSNNQRFGAIHACMKLAIACGEAVMIKMGKYSGSYTDRLQVLVNEKSHFSAGDYRIIESAFRGKLGIDHAFFASDLRYLTKVTLNLAITTLAQLGIRDSLDWERLARKERPWHTGLRTDLLHFFHMLLKLKLVPPRKAIIKVYRTAWKLAFEISTLEQTDEFPGAELSKRAKGLFHQFKASPQFISVVHHVR